uniref:Uncharacterized protein n=1 Tax=viral metagenome TaxID=1070528 RepID=A0A6M3X485_9ZZZZ
MVFVIVSRRTSRRVRVHGKLTPAFEYYAQADNYLYRRLNDSKLMTIKQVGILKKER